LVRVKYTRWEDIDNEFYRKTFKKNNNNGKLIELITSKRSIQ